jgi:hypothetical protein
VTLTFCSDVSAADWITASGAPWQRLVTFGPPGFAAYALLRSSEQLGTLVDVLSGHTVDADDCYFCVWDGFGIDPDDVVYADEVVVREEDPNARPGLAPARGPSRPEPPKVVVPHRAYYLFHGSLSDISGWDAARGWPGRPRLDGAEPAFVWPADRAWCVAKDVDPDWAGLGTGRDLMARLIADPRIDVVPADPTEE